MRQIRLKDLNRLYDFVVVKTDDGERECHPRDVKVGEIVELPVNDSKTGSDLAFFQVLPDLTPAGVVEQLLSEGGMEFDRFEIWQTNAKHRGLVVRTGTHPETGDIDVYSTAKDREGNERGFFDHLKQHGELHEA